MVSQTNIQNRASQTQERGASQLTTVGRSRAAPYLFIGPAAAVIAVVMAFPILYAGYRSTLHDRLLEQETFFVGLGNYVAMLQNPSFWSGLQKSAIFAGGTVALGMVLAVVFAFALNRAIGGLRFIRGLTIIPYIVSSVAVAVMYRMFFNTDFGLPNQLLGALGFENMSWLGNPALAMVTVIVAQVWGDLPLAIIIILAGLQTLDPDLLDAASIDGATGWPRARRITLPLILPQLVLSMVFLSFTSLTTLGIVLALTGGGPGTSTQTLPLEMYRMAFEEFDMGQAMAISITIFLLNALVAVVLLRVQRRYGIS